MRGSLQRSTVIVAILVGAAAPIRAQVASGPPASMDSAFARARALVASGNGAAGRLLVDSVLAATDPASPSYSDALYWHAMLASNDSDAERDYRRIVVEYALAPRAADALLQLAQLESGHGDRSSATTHLARFFNENPSHPERGRAGALLTRLLFEQNDLPRACSALHGPGREPGLARAGVRRGRARIARQRRRAPGYGRSSRRAGTVHSASRRVRNESGGRSRRREAPGARHRRARGGQQKTISRSNRALHDSGQRGRGAAGAQVQESHHLRDGHRARGQVNSTSSTPLMQQYREIKGRHQNAILFFRMGEFYEMFYDDAETASRVLGLTLTSRNNGGAADVPLAGVPVKAAAEYVRRLVQQGFRVAICEQIEDPRLAKGVVRREVIETVTPGVAFSDELLDGSRNNFLVAVHAASSAQRNGADDSVGVAAADVSTGELRLISATPDELEPLLAR